jgi:hypothetical protein
MRRAGHLPPEPSVDLIMAVQPIAYAPEAVKRNLTRRRNVPRTIELLCHRHGEAKAFEIARREQKLARQKTGGTKILERKASE